MGAGSVASEAAGGAVDGGMYSASFSAEPLVLAVKGVALVGAAALVAGTAGADATKSSTGPLPGSSAVVTSDLDGLALVGLPSAAGAFAGSLGSEKLTIEWTSTL
jgi:hypothetical protein